MKLSLYQRLSFALLAVFIAITLVFFLGWQQVDKQTRQESEQKLHLSLAANLARDNPLLQQGVYDHIALENLFHTLMVLGPAFEFYFIDPKGDILTYSADSSLVKRNKISLIPIHLLIENKAPLPIFGDDPKHPTRSKIFSAAPVFNGANLQGYLYVIVAGERSQHAFDDLKSERRVEVSLLFIVGSLFFLFVVMLWLFRNITMPIRKLTEQMLEFKGAGFDISSIKTQFLPNKQDNEVSKLTYVFKEMAEQIDAQLCQLNQVDIKRKQLLTEISHDLRTPLASFKGYIETISLQGEKLSAEERQHYIEIALKNASHLNRLIDQIFELAHLESGQVSINLENFNLTELLYDIAAKFRMKADNAQVSITLNILPNIDNDNANVLTNVFVNSDIGKLERVLSNLLDNAIRHTAIGGEIKVNVEGYSDETLLLSISDNGTGIKTAELAYIFDARYRASNATAGKHSGLGLAISKKLTELLNSDLKVASELGQGTTFCFTLLKATEL